MQEGFNRIVKGTSVYDEKEGKWISWPKTSEEYLSLDPDNPTYFAFVSNGKVYLVRIERG